MPMKINEREYRNCTEFRAAENADEMIVEGYASTFDPYEMYEFAGNKYYERIDIDAFTNADMTDVIMQYDHEGRVYARQKNGTLELSVDKHGLKVRADLSRTEGARRLYEDIRSGMISEMSFAFTIDEEHYESDTRTRVIDTIRKVYDVSAVSIPANPGTEISARSYFDGVIEAEKQELLKAEARARRVKIMNLMLEVSK